MELINRLPKFKVVLFYCTGLVTLLLLLTPFLKVLKSHEFSELSILSFLGLVVLFSVMIRVPHIICSWWMVYTNPVIRKKYRGRDFSLKFIVIPIMIYLASLALCFIFHQINYYLMIALLLFTVICGPLAVHHGFAQDKGFLRMFHNGSEEDWRRKIGTLRNLMIFVILLYPIEFVVVKNYLDIFEPNSRTILQEGLILLGWVFLSLVIVFSTYIFWSSLKKDNHQFEKLYTFNLFGVCSSSLITFISGQNTMTILVHAIRHNVLYIWLVCSFFQKSKKVKGSPGLLTRRLGSGTASFLVITAGLSFPFMYFYTHVDFVIPSSWAMLASGEDSYRHWINPVGYSLMIGLNLHHYYLDRFSWKFSDPIIGRELKDGLSGLI